MKHRRGQLQFFGSAFHQHKNRCMGSLGLPRWLSGKESACQCRRSGSIPGLNPREDPLEKEMATHSRILAWEIPLSEEPGGL